jgi:uncharacterized membrane protein YphA (DoxX/SURF4 family)
VIAALLLAPLLLGWVNQCRAWFQNRSGPGLLQPYRLLHKLFNKDSVMAETASPLFRVAPYVVFGCMTLACAIIPTLSTDLPLSIVADAIAWGLLLLGASLLVGLFVRWSAPAGAALMFLYYLPTLRFPYAGSHGLIVDEHVVYILALLLVARLDAGGAYGLDGVFGAGKNPARRNPSTDGLSYPLRPRQPTRHPYIDSPESSGP